ncbi:Queuine tRNA-ribosyltransferase [Rubripirellula lacrimiformis]|uniref:Queuine tRNA-ribosyltransferase n=1 Tax=Rubripirellula lacrimiformis TaxID=1930273 RepID=A0A517N8I6_9BACT|nr:tRNA guanosine(34) transglycosylase Tgt [Rubripirellula lacrimiformis]QDT03442.1 Queuine tRNA-ribosyltransferase [Rubripirellula lacrimiformis]
MSQFAFELSHRDATTSARRGVFLTPHGPVQTPGFMPVGTQGTVKGVTIDQVAATGAHMILGNTYHLALRPGHETVRKLGGLHGMSGWEGPILTDSGGFQIFSLNAINNVTEEAATFRSHIDGAKVRLTPEHSIEIQEALGSDVAMVLDHVVALPAEPGVVEDAMARSIRWAKRCLEAASRDDQAKFAIVQGGLDTELRVQCATELSSMGFDGYAVGGLSVGEAPSEMYRITAATCPALPEDKPRYLMGVGQPIDLIESVARGIDLFDCVMPTRNGRNGLAFTDLGKVKLRNAVHREDTQPLEQDCPCLACRHSRGYLRHLFIAGEMLGPILVSIHNLTYYQRVMQGARDAIEQNRFDAYREEKKRGWGLV